MKDQAGKIDFEEAAAIVAHAVQRGALVEVSAGIVDADNEGRQEETTFTGGGGVSGFLDWPGMKLYFSAGARYYLEYLHTGPLSSAAILITEGGQTATIKLSGWDPV